MATPAVLLAAWCGLRRGEVCGLFNDDVDLVTGTVWVRRTHVELRRWPWKAFPAAAVGELAMGAPLPVRG